MPLNLTMAVRTYGHTRPLKDGRVTLDGVALAPVEVAPIVAAYRRMVRGLEFDVCELAATTYLVARAHGAPFTALPIFLYRGFHHGDVVCRADADVWEPRDLEGQRVGVRAYTVTTGVWARGVLRHEYGLDLARVTWVTDDEEHVAAYRPPPNVEPVPEGRSLASMLAAGELAAALSGAAGVGRVGPPSPTWGSPAAAPAETELRPLIPDAPRAEADWYRRIGLYPVHGLVVVKDALLAEHPRLAAELFRAFTTAKAEYLGSLDRDQAGPPSPEDAKMLGLREIVGPDPLPYGLEPNRATLTALIDFALEQQIIPARPEPADLFAPGTLDLVG